MSKKTSEANAGGFLERVFQLKAHNTTVRTEVMAGITTFMTMAYIIAVNPLILGDAGMDKGGVFTATILSTVIATLVMALYARLPFALAPGMGLNAYFTYSVVIGMGMSWEFALTAVLIEGVIFVLFSFIGVREKIFDSIPLTFICLIGLINGGLVVDNPATILGLGDLTNLGTILTILGLLITGALFAYKVRGALLIGILATTVIGIIMGVADLPSKIFSLPPSLSEVAFKFEWNNVFTWKMLIAVFTFLFVDVFDTVGTLAGVASKANMLDKDGKLPRVERALAADAVGTVAGACLGTSTVTTYVESAAGVAEGGKTGLTSFSTAVMFILALFFYPLFGIIPPQATAPALVIVGLFMMSPIKDLDLGDDYTEAIPAFLTIVMMPFAYSIAEGIVFGMVSYVILKLVKGKAKSVSITMYVLALLFILRTLLPVISDWIL